jgi:hypothetical protein
MNINQIVQITTCMHTQFMHMHTQTGTHTHTHTYMQTKMPNIHGYHDFPHHSHETIGFRHTYTYIRANTTHSMILPRWSKTSGCRHTYMHTYITSRFSFYSQKPICFRHTCIHMIHTYIHACIYTHIKILP